MSGDGGNRRYQRSYQGLLNFCLENTKAEDATSESSSSEQAMSEERRQWLEQAIAEVSGQDPVKAMMEDLRVLQTAEDTEEGQASKEEALEDLVEHCQSIDNACDFHKIGGYAFLTHLLKQNEADLKWRAADLLATTVQNNPYCQKVALELHYMPLLLDLIDQDPSEKVKVKALYATSCLTREDKDAQNTFMEHDGLSVLMRAMQTGIEKLGIKAAFLLTSLCQSRPEFKDSLCNMGMVDQLVALLQTEHNTFHEHLMSALLTLTEDHPKSQQECRREELDLRNILELKLEQLNGKEEHLEEATYTRQLLSLCFGDNGDVER